MTASGPAYTSVVVSVQRAAFGTAAEKYCEATEANTARVELHDAMLDAFRALPGSPSAAEYRTVLAVRLAQLEEIERAARCWVEAPDSCAEAVETAEYGIRRAFRREA